MLNYVCTYWKRSSEPAPQFLTHNFELKCWTAPVRNKIKSWFVPVFAAQHANWLVFIFLIIFSSWKGAYCHLSWTYFGQEKVSPCMPVCWNRHSSLLNGLFKIDDRLPVIICQYPVISDRLVVSKKRQIRSCKIRRLNFLVLYFSPFLSVFLFLFLKQLCCQSLVL